MSHFSVLVVTKTADAEELKKALQPYHEYECTGVEDEYVIWVPKEGTEEDWQKEMEGWNADHPDLVYPTIEKYMKDYYGATIGEDGKYGRFTNPNKKWDWWVVGGRWSKHLLLKNGTKVDTALKSTVDMKKMLSDAEHSAKERYDLAQSILKGRTFEPWSKLIAKHKDNIEGARREYWGQQAVKDLSSHDKFRWSENLEDFLLPRREFVHKLSRSAVGTFTVLKDGEWHERGEMGWWGCVSNEVAGWEDMWMNLWESIPDDQWVTVVDCHI